MQALANSYHVGGAYRRVRDAPQGHFFALLRAPRATGALPLACILVALARTTTLFVGNGLCAVPVSLHEKGDGKQANVTKLRTAGSRRKAGPSFL